MHPCDRLPAAGRRHLRRFSPRADHRRHRLLPRRSPTLPAGLHRSVPQPRHLSARYSCTGRGCVALESARSAGVEEHRERDAAGGGAADHGRRLRLGTDDEQLRQRRFVEVRRRAEGRTFRECDRLFLETAWKCAVSPARVGDAGTDAGPGGALSPLPGRAHVRRLSERMDQGQGGNGRTRSPEGQLVVGYRPRQEGRCSARSAEVRGPCGPADGPPPVGRTVARSSS